MPDRRNRSADDRERLVAPEPADQAAADDRRDEQPGHHRRQLQSGRRRAPPFHDLQEERQVRHRAEEREPDDEPDAAHTVKIRLRKSSSGRIGSAARCSAKTNKHEQDDAERDQDGDLRRAPLERRAAEAREQHDARQRSGEQRGAEIVDRVLDALGARVEDGGDHEERDRADRQVDVEDPAPREVVDEEAAEQRADDRRHAEDGAEEALVLAAVARRDDVADDGDRRREQAAGAETLQRAERDQLGHVLRDAAQRRADEEDDDRDLQASTCGRRDRRTSRRAAR